MLGPWPSLNAMRVFDVACRHMSFKLASQELHVSPAAVSQQIKSLEQHFCAPLFRRRGRALELTDTGRRLRPDLSAGFAAIERALVQATQGSPRILKIASAPAFAAKYLVPNIDDFGRHHPGCDVYVLAAHELIDYRKEHVDIGVRYGLGTYKGLVSERLLSDSVLPVCSPNLLLRRRAIASPKGLARRTLLHDDSLRFDPSFPGWRQWFEHVGYGNVDLSRGPHFSTASDAIDAAVQGSGVLLARRSLIATELRAKTLVPLLDTEMPVPHGFFLVYRRQALERHEVFAFRQWLRGLFAEGAAVKK